MIINYKEGPINLWCMHSLDLHVYDIIFYILELSFYCRCSKPKVFIS